jgi:hypothetical protein
VTREQLAPEEKTARQLARCLVNAARQSVVFQGGGDDPTFVQLAADHLAAELRDAGLASPRGPVNLVKRILQRTANLLPLPPTR